MDLAPTRHPGSSLEIDGGKREKEKKERKITAEYYSLKFFRLYF